jgi:hypothetical protein
MMTARRHLYADLMAASGNSEVNVDREESREAVSRNHIVISDSAFTARWYK